MKPAKTINLKKAKPKQPAVMPLVIPSDPELGDRLKKCAPAHWIHILKHGFTKHPLEPGTDLRYFPNWLGHGKPKTKEIYTHLAKHCLEGIKNPLDGIFDDSKNDKREKTILVLAGC